VLINTARTAREAVARGALLQCDCAVCGGGSGMVAQAWWPYDMV